jgi:hypothetical protein
MDLCDSRLQIDRLLRLTDIEIGLFIVKIRSEEQWREFDSSIPTFC